VCNASAERLAAVATGTRMTRTASARRLPAFSARERKLQLIRQSLRVGVETFDQLI
jgi:hypothetical protein